MITLIIGANETISKSLSDIPRKHEIKEQQKKNILCPAHILQKVLI
jgi:hypothetical protein